MTRPLTLLAHVNIHNSSTVDLVLLAVRSFSCVAFMLHGWRKLIDVSGFAAAHEMPVSAATAAGLLQFVGGLLLGFGLLVRLAAFGIAITMIVAVIVLIRAGQPFLSPGGHSWESAALYAVLMGSFVLTGAGRYSVDQLLFARQRDGSAESSREDPASK
jgi:putative oxidoreductase